MHILKTIVAPAAAFIASLSAASAQAHPGGCGTPTVALIVEPALVASIRAALDQFENDLCARRYNTIEQASGFADPVALRSYLRGLYYQFPFPSRHLIGALLIGDVPHAYQLVRLTSANPSIPSMTEEVISFQYYSDLNGSFTKSPEYASPGGHLYSYDLHSGDVGWEIWVGVLPRYKGDLPLTSAAINRYFAKNHLYRGGQLRRPSVFLEVSELQRAATLAEHDATMMGLRSGPYSWTPYSSAPGSRLYFDSPPGGLSVQQGYADMRNGVADFSLLDAHGYWGASGQLTSAIVESSPVKTLFFWSNGCAVGDLDHPDNFLSSVLYSSSSDVLVAKGTTNNSGGMGSNANGSFGHNIATALDSGVSFGGAILQHVNVPLLPPYSASREFHFATIVVLGDPTLGRTNEWRAQPSYRRSCATRPPGTVCAAYEDGYLRLVSDVIRGWDKRIEPIGTVQSAIGSYARYEHILGSTYVRVAY